MKHPAAVGLDAPSSAVPPRSLAARVEARSHPGAPRGAGVGSHGARVSPFLNKFRSFLHDFRGQRGRPIRAFPNVCPLWWRWPCARPSLGRATFGDLLSTHKHRSIVVDTLRLREPEVVVAVRGGGGYEPTEEEKPEDRQKTSCRFGPPARHYGRKMIR